MEHDSFFVCPPAATGVFGASTYMDIFAGRMMLTEGRSARSLAQQTRISDTQNMIYMKTLVKEIVEIYEAE